MPVSRGDAATRSSPRGRRREHDLGHRQRAAGLPDRPVPDPRTGHQRQDALDRPVAQRRRLVRDRCRRFGAQARAAVRPEDHLRWDSLGEFLALAVSRFEFLADKTGQRRGRQILGRVRSTEATGTRARRGSVTVAQGRRTRQPRQPLLPRALLGAGPRRPEATTRLLPSQFAPIADRLAADQEAIAAELALAQGKHRSISAVTTTSTVRRPTRRCVPAPRSTAALASI